MITLFKCTKCNNEKESDLFPKSSRSKTGHLTICKECINAHNKQYRDGNKDMLLLSRKKLYQKNIEKMRSEKRDYYKKHKKDKAEYDILYREKHKKKIKDYKKNWEKEKAIQDPIFKIKRNLRRRVHHALKDNKKVDNTFELIGCTPAFFKNYIESLFLDGMTWDNYGFHGWHIDHIIPCYSFDLSKKEEQLKCFHYTNQRPLWAKDNLKRSKKEF